MTISSFAVSETCIDALHFLERNHGPKLLITDMLARTVADGKINVTTLQGECRALPSGLDIYTLGFPCTPWSFRGVRGGFEDANSMPLRAGIATIKTNEPTIWVIECVSHLGDVTLFCCGTSH